MQVKIKKLRKDAVIPAYGTEGAACFDLAVPTGHHHLELRPGWQLAVGTGLAFEIPEGHVMLVFSRSGHGFKNNVRLSNCVGVIDSDYRGELVVKLKSDSLLDELSIRPGDRIAQAMIVPFPRVEFVEVDELTNTERGDGGFGSTGA